MTIVLCQRNARSQADPVGPYKGHKEDTQQKMDGFSWFFFGSCLCCSCWVWGVMSNIWRWRWHGLFRDQILVMIQVVIPGILGARGLRNASFFNVTSFGPVTDLFRGLSDLHFSGYHSIVTLLHTNRKRQNRILGCSSPRTAKLTCSPPNDEEVLLPIFVGLCCFFSRQPGSFFKKNPTKNTDNPVAQIKHPETVPDESKRVVFNRCLSCSLSFFSESRLVEWKQFRTKQKS